MKEIKRGSTLTIKDIARQSGYGVTTVSRVLNDQPNVSEEAREKILEVVHRTGFRLNSNAKRLKQQSNSGIAVVVKGTNNMLFPAILERVQSQLLDTGCACLINYVDESANEVEEAVRICAELHPLGLLFLGGDIENFRAGFSAITVPGVLMTGSAASLGFDTLSSVSTDDAFAAECAIEYLLDLGHKKIGILSGYSGDELNPAGLRRRGCLRAFERRGVAFDEARQLVISRYSLPDSYRATGRLLDSVPELTAVFAAADVMAIGAIRAIRDRGLRVPEDVSVVGFDGVELGEYLTPKLGTVRQDSAAIADRSVTLLLASIRENAGAVHELAPFRFAPGESARRIDT